MCSAQQPTWGPLNHLGPRNALGHSRVAFPPNDGWSRKEKGSWSLGSTCGLGWMGT